MPWSIRLHDPERICVIFNPAAGKGQARRLIRRAVEAARCRVQLLPTRFAGHASELAQSAVEQGCSTVIAAGGDGTVHEVANGILSMHDADATFGVWPIGSANDYAFSLGMAAWWKGRRHEALTTSLVDVGRVAGGGKSRYFVNGLGLGFNGAVTLESRKINWLRGMPLYALATLKALWRHFRAPPMRIAFDSLVRETRTLALSVCLGQREGNFPLTPHALLDDGLFDVVHAGDLRRWELLKYMPAMATGKLPTAHPKLFTGRCRNVTVAAAEPVRIHVDGEFFCHPEDGIRDVVIELLPARLRVLTFPAGQARSPS